MNFRLRPVAARDPPKLYALDHACFAPDIAWSRAELTYFLRYPGNHGWVAEDESGAIAGFAISGQYRRRGALLGRLITIDVDAAWRRRGVGHALLEALEARLRAAGATAITLEVAVDNVPAQAFYQRHGYVRTGRIPGYYADRIDALIMEKALLTGAPVLQ